MLVFQGDVFFFPMHTALWVVVHRYYSLRGIPEKSCEDTARLVCLRAAEKVYAYASGT